MNIQWYPGHMTKTRRMIQAQLGSMDAVCEILDARIPRSSQNPDIQELTKEKPKLASSSTRGMRARERATPKVVMLLPPRRDGRRCRGF